MKWDLTNDPTAIAFRAKARESYNHARAALLRARIELESACHDRLVGDELWLELRLKFAAQALETFFWERGRARIYRDTAKGEGTLFRVVDPWSSRGWKESRP